MREERVTINILNWLECNGWKIVCYDFPQSGTGVLLHPNSNNNRTTKNKGGIIPDILATRNFVALYFENKDKFVLSDFEKLKEIKHSGKYSAALNSVFDEFGVTQIYYGVGLPAIEKHIKKALENLNDIDFLISTSEDEGINIIFDKNNLFI